MPDVDMQPSIFLPQKPPAGFANGPLDGLGNTYLHELCVRKAPLPVIREAVMKLGADVGLVNQHGMTPLGAAIQYCDAETVSFLIEQGSSLFFTAPDGKVFNAAHLAASRGDPAVLDAVLKQGGGVYVNEGGTTYFGATDGLPCLHMAIGRNHPQLIDALINAGAFIDLPDASGQTPLHRAVMVDSHSMVTRLLRAGANPDAVNTEHGGLTPLQYAACFSRFFALNALIDAGVPLETENPQGKTALHLAAEHGCDGGFLAVMRAGADIHHAQGLPPHSLPLHVAAEKGRVDMVRALLAAGADPLLADAFNRSALMLAEDNNNYTTKTTLRDAEACALRQSFEKSYRKYKP